MNFKRIRRAYFVFSKKERNATIVLLLLIFLSLITPVISRAIAQPSHQYNYAALISEFAVPQELKVHHEAIDQRADNLYAPAAGNPDAEFHERGGVQFFEFDPNSVTMEELVQLGLSEKIANRWIHYREKGGVFRTASDILKIYGMDEKQYEDLKEYIRIDSTFSGAIRSNIDNFTPIPETVPVEINSASLSDLVTAGFSDGIAQRILKFRNGLGGLYSLSQLEDVYGLDKADLEEAVQSIVVDPGKIVKLNLNTCSETELEAHSYIRPELAKEIIIYRQEHGRFVSVTELMKVKGMYPALFEKLKPYIII